ncbi:MAG: hypothetical protein CAPSK01_003514 [Candidatus Accumulibacter vicinus]|uniref:Uncharacterized protein n=1 Tax=Candidatus Accumulibacter vicinus TaxID=2954382 RepID=A0A084XXF7_9PROT|nr:MAG: hypothetical protein CAPSK01_003514 [Candidatus Accumulibacter vicinus]
MAMRVKPETKMISERLFMCFGRLKICAGAGRHSDRIFGCDALMMLARCSTFRTCWTMPSVTTKCANGAGRREYAVRIVRRPK